MKNAHPSSVDESLDCEITIRPDGRIYAFGITRSLLEVLAAIPRTRESQPGLLDRLHDRPAIVKHTTASSGNEENAP